MIGNHMPITDGTWLTPAQAARALDVTPNMVRVWADRGVLVCDRTPLGRLLSAESVERLRTAREAKKVGGAS